MDVRTAFLPTCSLALSLQALNDKKRLATSGANFARSRTVTDGSCAFPNNWVGCENGASMRPNSSAANRF